MTRRTFTSLLSGSAFAQRRILPELAAAPNFCSHEHWGSIDSIGTFPGGYRCDIEQGARPKRTSLWDLVLDPYLRGVLLSSGTDRAALTRRDGWAGWAALKTVLQDHQFNGIYQCTRRGILALYGIDIETLQPGSASRLDTAIDEHYRAPFDWYRTAIGKAHFSELIRPVHPEFYRNQESPESAREESAFTRTVMRIDPFLDLWTLPLERRGKMIELSRVEPLDAKTWRAFLAYWFDQAQQNNAVGIKQLQAYRRDLNFQAVPDNAIDNWRAPSSAEARRKLQDWIVHECCKQAHERGWAHQVHVGTNNLPDSSPLPLAALARRYTRMKLVMIHCWPFIEEAGALARQNPNLYIDTCWQPILNPVFFRTAMSQWWNYVPSSKITCGHDATTVEMAVGSSIFTREILSDIVEEQKTRFGVRAKDLVRAAEQMLHGNAVRIYGYGHQPEKTE